MSARRGASLRRKLFTAFGALAALGAVLAGVTVFAILAWSSTEEALQGHYVRSLRAQEVRALTFQAFREIPDALVIDDPDARAEFAAALQPAEAAFAEWAGLAETDEEQAQVALVREAYDVLVAQADIVFDLVEAGDREAAVALAENELEDQDFARFVELTEAAVASDRDKRRDLVADTLGVRRATTLTLLVAGVGVLAVTLLVAAYLGGDIFRPLRRLQAALEEFGAGDPTVRLDAERGDELGAANRAFNEMAEHVGGPGTPVTLTAKAPLTRVEPATLLRDALTDVQAELVTRRVSVALDVDAELGPVRLDRVAVQEALSELVRNALDALPQRGGRLGLRAGPVGAEAVSLEVSDDGSGLDPDAFDALAAAVADGSLTGRGLRTAAATAQRHSGRFVLRRRDDGGTVAQLLLPLAG